MSRFNIRIPSTLIDRDGTNYTGRHSAVEYDYNDRAVLEPSDGDIPKVFFTGTAPTTKVEDELPLTMEYRSKTLTFKSYVTLKVQGDSSSTYPKKNFNIKMFKDSERTEKDKRVFKNWTNTNKFCLKANWIDHTHARNVVNGRLWGQVVRSRFDYNSYPEEYRESTNCGAVDGFPIKVYINGAYQGLYTWNIRKDESMFNMDKDAGVQSALIADAPNNVTLWRELPAIDGTDWTDELNDTVPDVVKTSFQNLYSFVMDSTDEEFKENIGNYFYLSSLIDYYIFVHSIYMIGGFSKSQTMLTYDSKKYLSNIYDMDTTWALHWDGSYYYDINGDISYANGASSNLLYSRLSTLFADEITARYTELRNSVLSEANIINEFERFMDVISNDLYDEDYASTTASGAFVDIPSKDTNTLQKLREIIVQRLIHCDEQLIPEPVILYTLPNETMFDGSVDKVIDTGVKLLDKARDFTIVVDFTDDANVHSDGHVFGIPEPASNKSATAVDLREPGDNYCGMYAGNDSKKAFDNGVATPSRVKLVIIYKNGVPSSAAYSNTVYQNIRRTPNAIEYIPNNLTLCIGGFRGESGYFYQPWSGGTIHSFTVYNYAFTEEEIVEAIDISDFV